LAGNLYRMRLIPGKSVLEAAEWPDPEATMAQAKLEFMQEMQAQATVTNPQIAALQGLAGLMGGRRTIASFPAGGQVGSG
jgi:hypothetical protein